MKDIQEIITEMEDISRNQIAVDLSEEEKEELRLLISQTAEESDPQVLPLQLDSICTEPCCDQVPFCCTVDVPKGFIVDLRNFTEKINFNSCLSCVPGDTCFVPVSLPNNCNPFTVPVTPIKVVGCIQFVISVPNAITGQCSVSLTAENVGKTLCPTTPPNIKSDISCIGSVCVNQVVSYVTGSVSCNPIPCDVIKFCLDAPSTEDCNGNTLIKFTGRFILPTTCPPPTTCVPSTTCPPPCTPGFDS